MVAQPEMTRVIRVRFPEALDVCLVGAFNDWSTAATPMKNVGQGVWQARLGASIPLGNPCFFVRNAGEGVGRLLRGTPDAEPVPRTADELTLCVA